MSSEVVDNATVIKAVQHAPVPPDDLLSTRRRSEERTVEGSFRSAGGAVAAPRRARSNR